jgi:uncharacterized repeat protein (TIGR04138 family)
LSIDERAMQAAAGKAYPLAAFEFVRLGMAHTARLVHGEPPSRPGTTLQAKVPTKDGAPAAKKVKHPTHLITGAFESHEPTGEAGSVDESRHVSGQQLCEGLKDFAIRQYGLLAGPVLRSWGMTQTSDFGNIVFAMIAVGLFRKTEEDSKEDFESVYQFDDAFPDVLRKS